MFLMFSLIEKRDEDGSLESLRYQYHLDGSNSREELIQEAEDYSFYTAIDKIYEGGRKFDILRILSGNYNMISKIEKKSKIHNGCPLNYIIICGKQHAGGIANILKAKALFVVRKEYS